jgi:hypothetical protein
MENDFAFEQNECKENEEKALPRRIKRLFVDLATDLANLIVTIMQSSYMVCSKEDWQRMRRTVIRFEAKNRCDWFAIGKKSEQPDSSVVVVFPLRSSLSKEQRMSIMWNKKGSFCNGFFFGNIRKKSINFDNVPVNRTSKV